MGPKKKNNSAKPQKDSSFFSSLIRDFGPTFFMLVRPVDIERRVTSCFRDFAKGNMDLQKYGKYFLIGAPGYRINLSEPKPARPVYNDEGFQINPLTEQIFINVATGKPITREDTPAVLYEEPINVDTSQMVPIREILYREATKKVVYYSIHLQNMYFAVTGQTGVDPNIYEQVRQVDEEYAMAYQIIQQGLYDLISTNDPNVLLVMMSKLSYYRNTL